jgi:hypothetical protein
MLQDSYSHQGYSWYTGGHLRDGFIPDMYDPNNPRDRTMEHATRHFLREFAKHNRERGCP